MGTELNLKNTYLHIAFNKILFVYSLRVFLRGKSLKYKNTRHLLKLMKMYLPFTALSMQLSKTLTNFLTNNMKFHN